MPEIEYTDIKPIYNAFRIYAYIISPETRILEKKSISTEKQGGYLKKPERIRL